MKKGSGISFHRFPVKHPELLHKCRESMVIFLILSLYEAIIPLAR